MNAKTLIPKRTSKPVSEVDERGETVLYDQAGGKLLVLNDVGAGVWSLVDGARSVAEIARLVHEHLPADVQQVERDVERFFADLERHELLAFG